MLHYGPSLNIRGLFGSDLNPISCDIIELSMQFQKLNSAMGFQKGSELVPLFNYHIAKLTEQGQVHKLIEKYLPPRDPASCTQTGPSPIQLVNVFSAFIFLVVGGIIAGFFNQGYAYFFVRSALFRGKGGPPVLE